MVDCVTPGSPADQSDVRKVHVTTNYFITFQTNPVRLYIKFKIIFPGRYFVPYQQC